MFHRRPNTPRIHLGLGLILAGLFASLPAFAQQYPVGSDRAVNPAELFTVCAFCHGAQGQGGPALDAPPLAGMEAWYVIRQLHAFRSGMRGTHPEDVPGQQMVVVSGMVRNDATIASIAAYIQNMPTGAPPETTAQGEIAGTDRPFIWRSPYAELNHPAPADTARGEALYAAACVACHGPSAQGIQTLGAPRLTDLPEWYMHRQLQYFKDGLRGTHPNDTFGATMVPFAKMLPDDQAIADVVGYIKAMPPEVVQLAEIKLIDSLDETRGWCVDLFAHLTNAMPLGGFQGHNCFLYMGRGPTQDQGFEVRRIREEGVFELSHFNMCMTMQEPRSGSYVGAEPCVGEPAQQFDMREDGRIVSRSAPDLCLTMGDTTVPGGGRLAAVGARPPANNTNIPQIRKLTFDTCSDAAESRQRWELRMAGDSPETTPSFPSRFLSGE